jgi:hypothetical protein
MTIHLAKNSEDDSEFSPYSDMMLFKHGYRTFIYQVRYHLKDDSYDIKMHLGNLHELIKSLDDMEKDRIHSAIAKLKSKVVNATL